MNTNRNNKSGSVVVRGHAYTALRYQPRNIFCLNEAVTDKLDEFLNVREHDRIMEAKWNPKDIVVVKGKVQTAKEQALCLKGVL
jgi:hypothetical protein